VAIDAVAHKEISRKGFHFLYLGQIEEHKGIDLLLDAFAGVDAMLHVAGNGGLLDHIRGRAKVMDNVVIYGRVERDKLPELFHSVDVTVVPSLCYENSPTVIFESFAFSVPVLASKIEGIAELIDEDVNGFTFEAGNKNDLKEKIIALSKRDDLATIANKAKEVLVDLTREKYISQLEEMYKGG
jgi:Glycosyltransferase